MEPQCIEMEGIDYELFLSCRPMPDAPQVQLWAQVVRKDQPLENPDTITSRVLDPDQVACLFIDRRRQTMRDLIQAHDSGLLSADDVVAGVRLALGDG